MNVIRAVSSISRVVPISLLLLLAACSLETGAISPARIEAAPRFICPCETVSVDWMCASDVDDNTYCDRVSLSSTNPAADLRAGPTEKIGHRELPMVCLTTLWLITTEYRGRTEETGTNVTVIDEDRPLELEYELQPGCSGASVVWEPLPLKDLNSPCVAISNFCNNSGSPVRVTPEDERATIVPPGCTTDFNGPPRNLTIVPELVPHIPGGGACGAERRLDLLAPIAVSVTRECDRGLEDCNL